MTKRAVSIMLIIILCVFIVFPSFTTATADMTEITFQTIDQIYFPYEDSYLERSVKRVEEKYDIEFYYNHMMTGHYIHEFDVVDEMMKRIKSSEANNELYGSTQLGEFMARDMLYPLDYIIEPDYYENLPPTFRPIKKAATCKLNNQLYALPSISRDPVYGDVLNKRSFPFNLGPVVFWNRDIFEKHDLPDPYQLKLDNQWSWEKMGEIAELATQDLNNDGTIDQWGLTGIIHSDYAANPHYFAQLLMSFGAELIEYKPDGIRPNITGPEVLELIDYLYTWNNEKEIIPPDKRQFSFSDGEVAMRVSSLLSIHRMYQNISDFDFGFVYLPSGTPYKNNMIPVSRTHMAALPVTVENPEFIIEVYNDIYQPEFERINDEIKAFPDEMGLSGEDKERYLKMSKNWEPVDQLSPAMMEQTDLDEVISGIINGEYDRDKVDVLNELLPELYEWISDMLE